MARPPAPSRVSVRHLAERLAHGEPLVILDVRRSDERAHCAIAVPEAATDLFVPMDEVSDRLEEIRAAASQKSLVVYCHHGVRSLMVAGWLASQGIPGVLNLDGGIDAWSNEVDRSVARY